MKADYYPNPLRARRGDYEETAREEGGLLFDLAPFARLRATGARSRPMRRQQEKKAAYSSTALRARSRPYTRGAEEKAELAAR